MMLERGRGGATAKQSDILCLSTNPSHLRSDTIYTLHIYKPPDTCSHTPITDASNHVEHGIRREQAERRRGPYRA